MEPAEGRLSVAEHLPHGKDARAVDEAMRSASATLPGELLRTITGDQGKEMSRHAHFTIDTAIAVYFCHPHSPWQQGSNENTNGLLRQYMHCSQHRLPNTPASRLVLHLILPWADGADWPGATAVAPASLLDLADTLLPETS